MRNYKKEAKWSKEKYKDFHIKIDKELGEKFGEQMKKENKSITEYFRLCIKNFLNK